jgi:DNA-binding CsgD family transcriptional regulator
MNREAGARSGGPTSSGVVMSDGAPRRALRGRRRECAALDRLVVDVGAGRSRVLVLRGEAGVGKSALVEHLVQNAGGARVARAVGVESEMEMAFAGLHLLCGPMLGHLDRLPEPQREALCVAFGLAVGSAPDRFLVGLAVLSLLAEVAEDQPLVCVVDDAQWLDRVSAQTLAFVARRLLAERVALVFAVRGPTPGLAGAAAEDHLAGLPELAVTGLGDDDARALLESAVPGRLDERVRDRILAEARGNPLALLELPRGVTAAELAGGFARPDARPLAGRIEQSFVHRIGLLPVPTQRLLLVAAAEPVGDVPLLGRVVDRLGIGMGAATPAEAAGLVEIGARVRFRHPLVRSASYRAADPQDRRDAHLALAEATDPGSDPDRRAWHRALAAVEPDEEVAAELERSAGRAEGRGGMAAAAAFLRRATELTPDPARRGVRALAAARATFEAGAPVTALELLAAAEMSPLDELRRARSARLRGQIVYARRRGGDAVPLLLDAAERLERVDDGQAREAYLEAVGAAVFAGRLAGRSGLREVADAARAAPRPVQPRRPVDLLLHGLATLFTEGHASGAAPLKRALEAFRGDVERTEDDVMRWLWLTWPIAAELWDDRAWLELTTLAVGRARASGALTFLPLAVSYRAAVHVHAGEFDAASALVEESTALTELTGITQLGYSPALLVAWRGEDAGHLARLDATTREALTWGEGRARGGFAYLTALMHNGWGQYQQALAAAGVAYEHEDLGVFGFTLLELVEAGARAGDTGAAAAALRRLEERTAAAGTEWALGVLARSRALLAPGDTAEALYREAVERLGHGSVVVHLARTHLVYGEWLRRAGRRRDAREQLRTAYEMLDGFGATAFAERARRELVATGETVNRRAPGAPELLTPQEAQIAGLAGDGKSNPEIGAELFISPRTVEWHLHKVFTKLGVDSRGQLRAALVRP